MRIFKRFKKRIEEKNKFKRLEELFDEVDRLFPNSYYNMMIHGVNLEGLDRSRWVVEPDNTAHRIGKDLAFDICLFGKRK